MRPLLAALIVAAVFSLLGLYMRFEQSMRSRAQAQASRVVEPAAAKGIYSLQIELTFDAQADPFGLDPASVIVELGGREVLRREALAAAGDVIVVDDVQGVVAGSNEFHVSVAPSDEQRGAANAVRVRVLRDGVPVPGAETTIWSEPGQAVQGNVVVEVDEAAAHEDHRHD